MMNCVAVGKVTKVFKPEQGCKAVMELLNGKSIFLLVKWDNQVCETIKAAEGKSNIVCLYGDIRIPGKDATSKKPILEVKGVNDGAVVIAQGRITRDPELKYTPNGKQHTDASIALNYGWGDRRETDFMNLTVWGNDKEKNSAVALAERGAKGQQIIIGGRLNQNEKDGKEYVTAVVNEFELLFSPKKDNENNAPSADHNWDDLGTERPEEEEIPF